MLPIVPLRRRTFAVAVSGLMTFAVPGGGYAQPATQVAHAGPAVQAGGVLMARNVVPQIDGLQAALIAAVAKDDAVAAFFRDRNYQAFWTAAGPEAELHRASLLGALDTAGFHALPVSRYDAETLRRAFRDLRSEGDRARLEVRLTRALIDFATDLHGGALLPARIDATIVRETPRLDPAAILQGFQAAPQRYLTDVAPKNAEYARLAKARLTLQSVIAGGGWGPEVAVKSLRPGAAGPQVVALRDRLAAMGYLGRTATATYDGVITEAVRRFQATHGLVEDGVAGEGTITQLNISADQRLHAVTVAMERERWANIERGARHIWVNLTDFSVQIYDEGKVSYSTRAVIGSTVSDKRTPEFSHRMTYMEINPDWTVPSGIIRRDYLPRLQANPGALGHLQVVDSRGRVVPRDAVDFTKYSARNFPFSLRQPPGPGNSLGRVKFMFPNPWAIYLHDTPDKHLFKRDRRAFSSGCVRLNDPFDFAYKLLERQEEDPRRAFHRALDSGKQTRISLKEPVPVHLDYRTAFTDVRGALQFRADVYGRDAEIYAALLKAGVDG